MTPFLLLSLMMMLATLGWLTRPLWARAEPPARFDETAAPPRTPPPKALIVGLAAFVLAVAGIGYAWVGTPQHLAVSPSAAGTPATRSQPQEPVDAALVQAESRVASMIDSLAQRLKSNPNDAEGWRTLARSQAALGRHAAAIDAFRHAVALRPDDPTLLAEFAFSAAVIDPYAASGEAAQLIERALRLDPANPKALALAGTLALDRKDYQAAVDQWEHLARIEPPDSPITKQLQFSIQQARQLAAGQARVLAASTTGALPGATAAGSARIGGTVTLAPALRGRVEPTDTVFVFARAAHGPRMPLAVLRRQVKDLPLRFTLDDSLAMSPTATLSKADSVIVGARIARGGNAVARDGDLQGQLPATPLGRDDLRIEINEVVTLR